MSPVEIPERAIYSNKDVKVDSGSRLTAPLKPTGVLDKFDSFDVTPVIGREFPNANLKEWLRAPNSDELLRELAITGTNLSSQ